jgi:hypothetical protein
MKLISTVFIASLLIAPPKVIIEKWVIEKNSNLCIEGRSNVNSFRCDVIEYLHPDTVLFYKEEQQPQFNIKGGLTIKVNGFDCHQRYMTNDLRKTLKADDYPSLKIDLLSIGNFTPVNKNIKGAVAIALSGIARKMEVDYTVQTGTDGNLYLNGSRQVLFSDFGLTPPRKLAGLIKVEEQINIRFQLILRPLLSNTTGGY